MRYLILFLSTSLFASQALTKLEQERVALIQECNNLRVDMGTIINDVRHPGIAIEHALEVYIEKVVKTEVEKVAKAEVRKLLEELHLTWIEKK